MEAKFGGKAHHPHMYGPMVPDLKAVGKKSSLEWDLNDWRWDGDLLTATPLNSIPPDCGARRQCANNLSNSSSSYSDELFERAERDLEKRRRGAAGVEEDDDDGECLRLGAGGQAYPISEGEVKSGKKSKVLAAAGVVAGPGLNSNSNSSSSRAVCQVEDCRADLSNAKDYHKRHKVCDMHSKASKALVGSIMQRFCQQCSRFHVLQEFDEGKRSCRRRLAGHNRRRRKTHPDTVVNGGALNDEKGSSYLLISLLRILSNMHANSSDQTRDQDLLSHLLKNLASVAGTVDGRNISALLQGSQGSFNAGTSIETSQKPVLMIEDGPEPRRHLGSTAKMDDPTISQAPSNSGGQCPRSSVLNTVQTRTSSADTNSGAMHDLLGPGSTNPLRFLDGLKAKSVVEESTVGRIKYNNIDLNSIYDDSQDHLEDPGSSYFPGTSETVSHDNPLFAQHSSHKSSPPQLSRNSDSTTTQSPSSSSGEAQSRTDRIVFKLFGKDPSDLPVDLRTQIFNWLSNSPTDIESYIRPGCIILTIYLHLEKYTWEELCSDLGSSLKKLLDGSNDPFWGTGWVYCRVRNYVAFTYNGHLILDTPLPLKNTKNCKISSIKPVAVSLCEKTQFVVKGFNLFRPSTRLLCALDGKYLVQETCHELMDNNETSIEHEEIQSLRFSCSVPSVTGRGFIEVEDHGLSSSFFPFIVAEQEVCSEICTLEGAIDVAESVNNVEKQQPNLLEAKNQAMDFIHEMGWLLHRSRVKCRLGNMDPHSALFPFRRFRWLVEFSTDRDWCSVVNKLLCILFEGCVDPGTFSSVEVAILDTGLLHRAVRRNCRPMVELLLKFIPCKSVNEQGPGSHGFLFKPDLVGPNGLTPLHVAASQVGYESVLDALTDDPGKVGIEAWKNAKDGTGLTPNDYACLRGHYVYINLVQRKTTKLAVVAEGGHVVVDIPPGPPLALEYGKQQKQPEGQRTSKVASLEIDKFVAVAAVAATARRRCGACQHHQRGAAMGYGQRSSLVYRPAMLSMLAIAAVCVCVALLFKSSPEVLYVFQPFRWERLKYGSS